MQQTYSINFLCNPSKVDRNGEAPVEMTIIINNKRTVVKLQMKFKPEDFKKGKDSKKNNIVRQFIETTRTRVKELTIEMEQRGIELTAESLKDCFKRGGVLKTYTLDNLFTDYLKVINKRIGNDMTQDTYNRYEKARDFFYKYNKDLTKDSAASSVTLNNLLVVQNSLNKKYDVATSCNYLQKLKSMFKSAFENGKIPSNPAFGLKIDKGVKDTVLYLTQEELDKIRKKKIDNQRLCKVRDCFVFMCYTGLAYSDLAELTAEDFNFNNKGQIFIEKKRKKTGVRYTAVLMKDAKEIAAKYDFKLPVIKNQKMNQYLKEVQTICGIDKNLTTHTARHTCCSYLINHRDPVVPDSTIMSIMGWTNEKQLRHYARIMKETILQDVEQLSTLTMEDIQEILNS